MNFKKFWIWILLVLLAFSIVLFSYQRKFFQFSSPIDESIFGNFGDFISPLLGLVTLVLLYYTYKQTRETHELTLSDSIDNTFFNFIQTHHEIVRNLHNRITVDLSLTYTKLNEECGSPYPFRQDKDFFELMYRILHFTYRCRNNERDTAKVLQFFTDNNWVMGHYFRSVTYFIRWVHENAELRLPQRRFYIGFIQSQLTSDEIRLIFYYTMSRIDANERQALVTVFCLYDFFSVITDPLIYDEADRRELGLALRPR